MRMRKFLKPLLIFLAFLPLAIFIVMVLVIVASVTGLTEKLAPSGPALPSCVVEWFGHTEREGVHTLSGPVYVKLEGVETWTLADVQAVCDDLLASPFEFRYPAQRVDVGKKQFNCSTSHKASGRAIIYTVYGSESFESIKPWTSDVSDNFHDVSSLCSWLADPVQGEWLP